MARLIGASLVYHNAVVGPCAMHVPDSFERAYTGDDADLALELSRARDLELGLDLLQSRESVLVLLIAVGLCRSDFIVRGHCLVIRR